MLGDIEIDHISLGVCKETLEDMVEDMVDDPCTRLINQCECAANRSGHGKLLIFQ